MVFRRDDDRVLWRWRWGGEEWLGRMMRGLMGDVGEDENVRYLS